MLNKTHATKMPSKKHDKEEKKKYINITFLLRHIEKISHFFKNNKTICMTYSGINKLSKYIRG